MNKTFKKHNGNEIAEMMEASNYKTEDGVCHIAVDGIGYYAEYRQEQDDLFAPICDKDEANCIKLEEGEAGYLPHGKAVWLQL